MAARGVNKVIVLGNLGKDPEIRTLPNGGSVANITVATSESWRDKQTGEERQKVEWHNVAIFGKLAEIAGQYLTKGSQVYIEGALQTRKWQDQNGQDRYTTEIVVQGFQGVMQMIGSASNGQQQGNNNQQQNNGQQPQQRQQPQSQPQQRQQAPQQGGYQQQPQRQMSTQQGFNEPSVDLDDEIPF